MWNSTVRVASSRPNAGNWLLLALFALALASAGLSVALYIEPCDKKTSYETTNTTRIINMTTFENRSFLENVTVTETVFQLENVTTRENVTYDITYNVLQCINQIVAARLRHGSIMTSTPSTRRRLDGVAVGFSDRSIRSARSRFRRERT